MKWPQVLLLSLLLGLSVQGMAQTFSVDHGEFQQQATNIIRSFDTEAAYQVSNKFASAFAGCTSEQKDQVITIALEMNRRGHFRSTYFDFFAALSYGISDENLSPEQVTKVLLVTREVLETKTKKDFQTYANSLNFFFARRYLNFSNAIRTQALDGSYEFEVINGDPFLYESSGGDVVRLDSIAAGDPYGAYTADDNDEYVDPWAEDPYGSVEIEGDPWADQSDPWGDANDDPWADDPWGDNQDDPWASNDDPWADDPWGSNANNDPWGDNAGYDPWVANEDANDPWARQARQLPVPDRPDVDPPIQHDFVEDMRAQYYFPALDGPSVVLSDIDIFIETAYDSVTVSGIDGNFLLSTKVFAGEGGTMNWPHMHDRMEGAKLEFGEWHFNTDEEFFWTPNASLTFDRFSDQPIEGKFEFRAVTNPRAHGHFPIFSSNYADISVELSERASYTGGLEVRGNKFYGKSVSRELGTLQLSSPRGQVFVNSLEFVLGDSSMSTENGELILVHGSDTIYHPSVQVEFDEVTNELIVLRCIVL